MCTFAQKRLCHASVNTKTIRLSGSLICFSFWEPVVNIQATPGPLSIFQLIEQSKAVKLLMACRHARASNAVPQSFISPYTLIHTHTHAHTCTAVCFPTLTPLSRPHDRKVERGAMLRDDGAEKKVQRRVHLTRLPDPLKLIAQCCQHQTVCSTSARISICPSHDSLPCIGGLIASATTGRSRHCTFASYEEASGGMKGDQGANWSHAHSASSSFDFRDVWCERQPLRSLIEREVCLDFSSCVGVVCRDARALASSQPSFSAASASTAC